jgi:hypothetical protein
VTYNPRVLATTERHVRPLNRVPKVRLTGRILKHVRLSRIAVDVVVQIEFQGQPQRLIDADAVAPDDTETSIWPRYEMVISWGQSSRMSAE